MASKKKNVKGDPKKEIERSGLSWKPGKATPENPSATSLDVVLNKVSETYGEAVCMLAIDAAALRPKRISTGIFVMDYAMGGGGWPMGKISLLYGSESSGKSSLCLKTLAMTHKTCKNCNEVGFPKETAFYVNTETGESKVAKLKKNGEVKDPPEGFIVELSEDPDRLECKCGNFDPLIAIWIDTERSYDASWAERLGVRNDKIHVVWPESAEEAMDIADALLRTGEVDLLVMDSIAMLTPKKEIEASHEDDLVAVLARNMNRYIRKTTSAQSAQGGLANPAAPTVILINQTRSSISGYAFTEVLPGGKGQLFANAVQVRLRQGDWRKHQRQGIMHHVAMQTVFEVKKNKTGAPKRQGSYTMWVMNWKDGTRPRIAGEVEESETVSHFAKLFDVLPEGMSEEEAVEKCDESFEFMWNLRTKALEAMEK